MKKSEAIDGMMVRKWCRNARVKSVEKEMIKYFEYLCTWYKKSMEWSTGTRNMTGIEMDS